MNITDYKPGKTIFILKTKGLKKPDVVSGIIRVVNIRITETELDIEIDYERPDFDSYVKLYCDEEIHAFTPEELKLKIDKHLFSEI